MCCWLKPKILKLIAFTVYALLLFATTLVNVFVFIFNYDDEIWLSLIPYMAVALIAVWFSSFHLAAKLNIEMRMKPQPAHACSAYLGNSLRSTRGAMLPSYSARHNNWKILPCFFHNTLVPFWPYPLSFLPPTQLKSSSQGWTGA